jgi:hypothetical protein
MTASRRIFIVFFIVFAAALAWACVGDDPTGSVVAPDSGTVDTGGGSSSGGSSGTPDSGDPDSNGATCPNGIMCDGTCVNQTTDKKNCGRCAHDCGNGDCAAGVCKHVLVAGDANADGGTQITSIATDQTDDDPKGPAQRVFWTVGGGSGGIFQDNVVGGNTVKLSTTGVSSRANVVVNGATVYSFSQNFGGPPQPVLKATVNVAGSQSGLGTIDGPHIQAITFDAANKNVIGAYKTSSTAMGGFKCGPVDGTVVCGVLGAGFTGEPTGNVATDGTNLYYLDGNTGAIYRTTAANGGSSGAYKTGEAGPVLIRIDGAHLFWANSADKKIQRSNKGDNAGTITPLATTANAATGLAADALNVYWTDPVLGTVNFAPRTGTGPNTPYVTLGASSSPMRLVRDVGFLYFTHNGGIYRVALP